SLTLPRCSIFSASNLVPTWSTHLHWFLCTLRPTLISSTRLITLSTHVNTKVIIVCFYTSGLFTIYTGDAALRVVDIKSIRSVVAMIPYFKILENGDFETPEATFFLVEKP